MGSSGNGIGARYAVMLILLLTCIFSEGFTQNIAMLKPYEMMRKEAISLRSLKTSGDMIEFICNAPDYKIFEGRDGKTVRIKGFDAVYVPGEPMLPAAEYELALPPDVDPRTVKLEYEITASTEIPGTHHIMPAPPLRARVDVDKGKGELLEYWGPMAEISGKRNVKVYKSKNYFPLDPVELKSREQMRKWQFVRIAFSPVRYFPDSGRLVLIKSVKVTLRFSRMKQIDRKSTEYKAITPVYVDRKIGKNTIFRPAGTIFKDRVMNSEARQRFLNYDQAVGLDWYEAGDEPVPGDSIADYVIITTNDIVANSTVLNDFVNHKSALGHTVMVVTENDYGILSGQAPDGTAEKIRQWLIDNHVSLGIKWVLLIGDPDPDDPADPADTVGEVPMKMCWPHRSSNSHQQSPTDHFYADLTGNWDLDGDGFYGESLSISNPTSPDPLVDPESFSVRWTGQVDVAADGTCYFAVYSDEGARLSVDGTAVIDSWAPHFPKSDYGSIVLTAGMHDIEIEYYDLVDDGALIVTWRPPGATSYSYLQSSDIYHLSGGVYVAGGLDGEYFNNADLTDPVLTRVDSSLYFYWGTGDNGAGGLEFTQEVYAGRIPVYNDDYAALDGILQKMIDYETVAEIPPWRKRILMPMEPSDASTPGYDVGENIKDNSCIPAGLAYFRIYEEDYGLSPAPETTPCSEANVVAEWPNGYGMVTWFTHGWWGGASGVFSSASCPSLDDTMPSFTYQASCNNGYPEQSGNLGYSLLQQGAVATVSASRVSWYAPGIYPDIPISWGVNQSMAYYYSKCLLGGITAGQSLFAVKNGADSWMNNMDYNLYGDPSMSLFRPYEAADVDIIPVLDNSGSMWGYTSSSNADRKIDVLKEAAHQFVDMMEGDEGHQFGLVKFNTDATTLHALQPFSEAGKAAIHTVIDAITPTGLTSIGDGLDHARIQFTSNGVADNRKVVLLVTDGMENQPLWLADVEPAIISGDITVFPLGLGYSGNINEAKLIALAEDTGGDYRITDDDLVFRKYFVEILCEATDWSVVTDPVISLSAGQESSVPVNVSGADTEMIFTVYWSGHDNAVDFNLKAPNGKTYYPNTSASAYTYKAGTKYAFYRIKTASGQTGQWQMRVKAKNIGAGEQVRLSASAFSRSGTKMSVELDNGIIHTGDKNLIAVRLMHYGRPVKGADVKAYLDSPKTGFGNLIRYNPVDVKKLAVTKSVDKNDMDILQSTTEAVRTKLGDRFNLRMKNVFKLYDDGTHGDRVKDDGIYSVNLMNTRIPGSYTARIKAEFKVGGKTATREWTKTFTTKVAVDPRYSVVSAVPVSVSKKATAYSLNITPKDRFGNYMGPGHKLTMKGIDGKEYVFKDNLDGSYTLQQTLKAKSLKTRPQVQIKLDGVDFTRVTLK